MRYGKYKDVKFRKKNVVGKAKYNNMTLQIFMLN